MLTYVLKGTANYIKGVVATFTACGLNVDQLASRTWKVIWHLEMAGLNVIVLVGDGSTVNHAFFQRLPPLSPTDSGIVFDTLNPYSVEDRPIFLFTDTPHLLKTIRSCFSKSGAHKNTRLLKKNGQLISWQTIVTIFKMEENENVRFCHKLSNLHVNLNSYSIMKVYVAAQVMSRTVAAFIEQCNLLGTSETVEFIRNVNDFFDNLNGAHTDQAKRTPNRRLAEYKDVNDTRLKELMDFLDYPKKWEDEVNGLDVPEEQKPKMLLSKQTRSGVERTIQAFVGTVQYLLLRRKTPGVGFLMARIFQQDPLEHWHGDQRASGGGNTHPTVLKFLENTNLLDVKGSLGCKWKRGNTESLGERVDVNAALPKRAKPKRRKLQLNNAT